MISSTFPLSGPWTALTDPRDGSQQHHHGPSEGWSASTEGLREPAAVASEGRRVGSVEGPPGVAEPAWLQGFGLGEPEDPSICNVLARRIDVGGVTVV